MAADQDAAQYVLENVGVAFGLPDLDSTIGAHYVIENVGVSFGLPDIDSTVGAQYVFDNVGLPQNYLGNRISLPEWVYFNTGTISELGKDTVEYAVFNTIEYIPNIPKFWDGNAWVSGLLYNGSSWEPPKYWLGDRWSD